MDETYLTTDQLIEYLHVNVRTVYRLIKAGKLPAVRVGRQWRFRKRDIDAWLDAQQAGAARDSLVARHAEIPAQARILVAADDRAVRELLVRTLTVAEYQMEVVADGITALDSLRQQRYDLIIADLHMPGMGGLALVREARRLDPLLAVVIITAQSGEASAIDANNLGVSGYLIAPLGVTQVLTVVAKALAR